MGSSPFGSRAKSGLAGLLSVVTLLVMLAYMLASGPSPSIAASYEQSSHAMVTGVIKTDKPGERTTVNLTFRDRHGRLLTLRNPHGKLTVVPVRVDRTGHWSAPVPPLANKVTIKIRVGGRSVTKTFPIKPGRTLKTTTVFPAPGSALLPGVFPY